MPERPAASVVWEGLLGNWEADRGSGGAARKSWKGWEISHFALSYFCLTLQMRGRPASAGACQGEKWEAGPSWRKEPGCPPDPQWRDSTPMK